MDEFYRVPTLTLLSILVAVFVALYARSRTRRTLLWLIGWSLAITRLVLQASPAGRHGWGLAISNTAMALAALMLLGSLLPASPRNKFRFSYIALFSAPLVLFSVLTSLFPSPGIFLRIVDWAAVIAAAAVAVQWSAQRSRVPRWFTVPFALGVSGACVWLAFAGQYDLVLRLTHSGISLMTAVLVLATYRRWSAGVIFTVTGMLMWSAPMVVDFLLHYGDPRLLIFLRTVNLMKVVTAVGMIVLVLEDQLIRNEEGQKRDRRVRAEMEEYSKLDVSEASNADVSTHYDHVCEVITQASRFRQAAILLRSVEQNFRVVGRAGMEGALAQALDAMGQRLTPETLEALVRSEACTPEIGNTVLLDLRTLMVPGDDLEPLGLVRIRAIPMGATLTELQGMLLLDGLQAPNKPLAPEDLLPLELLAARLAAGHQNTMLLRRIAQSEKLAGLGQLAGGVAHELNNPLTVVMGYAELIEASSSVDEATRRNASVIHSESQRMKQTIESLARFWRPSPTDLAPISVERMLLDIVSLRKPELDRAGVTLEVAIATDLPRIRVNGEQMRQVFLQILSNAATALQSSPLEEEKKLRIAATLMKNRVQVLISDTGPGFPNPNRVFDPFFTTKKPGEGSGLGLSLCYSIIREYGGEISAFNLQPHGAAVAIEMPAEVALSEASLAGEVFSQ
jgi:two-component system, NtrC family, sensor kinase